MTHVARLAVVLGVVSAWLIAGQGTADAKHYRYAGTHPVAKGHAGTYCYIEFPHVHVYAPSQPGVMYRNHDGWHHFVGDPVAHGYDGDRHSYHGAHPVHVEHSVIGVEVSGDPHVEWCYLKGPHFHAYTPPPSVRFVARNGVHFYVGEYPPAFHKHKRRYARINGVYVKYKRPVVVVDPPPGYVDVLVVAPAVHVHGKPRVDIVVPTPSVEISVGAGVFVGGHHHHKHKHRKHKHRKFKHHKKHHGHWH